MQQWLNASESLEEEGLVTTVDETSQSAVWCQPAPNIPNVLVYFNICKNFVIVWDVHTWEKFSAYITRKSSFFYKTGFIHKSLIEEFQRIWFFKQFHKMPFVLKWVQFLYLKKQPRETKFGVFLWTCSNFKSLKQIGQVLFSITNKILKHI